MKFAARFGTPNELDTKKYDTPSQAKNFVVGKIDDRMEWATRYSGEVARRLAAAKEELSNLNVGSLPKGDPRRWTVEDDVSGLKFVYEVERIA